MLQRRPRLFEGLFLQLFNDVSADLDWRRCASKTCDKWFPVTRPDRLYCDILCARAEAQRQLQRRGSKQWTSRAHNYVAGARRAHLQASWSELLEGFSAAVQGHPYRTAEQLQAAVTAAADRSDREADPA